MIVRNLSCPSVYSVYSVCGTYSVYSVYTSCVPNLQLDRFGIEVNRSYFLDGVEEKLEAISVKESVGDSRGNSTYKIYADG